MLPSFQNVQVPLFLALQIRFDLSWGSHVGCRELESDPYGPCEVHVAAPLEYQIICPISKAAILASSSSKSGALGARRLPGAELHARGPLSKAPEPFSLQDPALNGCFGLPLVGDPSRLASRLH